MELLKIIGLKVVAIKGHRTDRRTKRCITPEYILFSDGETYINLEDQDYYTHHDCAYSAKHIRIYEDERMWGEMMVNNINYPNANIDI